MKRKRYTLTNICSFLLVALFFVSFASCKDDEENVPVEVKTINTSNIGYTSLIVNAEVTQGNPTERGVCWNTTGEPTIDDQVVRSGSGKGIYETKVGNLQTGSVYYFRAYALSDEGVVYGETVTALTYEKGLPVVGIIQIHKATYGSVSIDLRVVTDGDEQVGERGICWSKTPSPTVEDHMLAEGEGFGSYSVELTGLTSRTTYYVRPYVRYGNDVVYGYQREFTTANGVKFNSIKAHDIYSYSASVTINNSFYVPVLEQGFIYSDTERADLTVENGVVVKVDSNEENDQTYVLPFDKLKPAKTYYIRSYIKTEEDGENVLYYGNISTFKTRELPLGPTAFGKYRKFAFDPEIITEGQSEKYMQVLNNMNEGVGVGHNVNLKVYYWDLIWEGKKKGSDIDSVKFHVSYKNVVTGGAWGAAYFLDGKYDENNASMHTSNLLIKTGNPTSLRNGIIKKGEPYITYMNKFFEYFSNVKIEWTSPETNELVKLIPIDPYEEDNYVLGKVSNP